MEDKSGRVILMIGTNPIKSVITVTKYCYYWRKCSVCEILFVSLLATVIQAVIQAPIIWSQEAPYEWLMEV